MPVLSTRLQVLFIRKFSSFGNLCLEIDQFSPPCLARGISISQFNCYNIDFLWSSSSFSPPLAAFLSTPYTALRVRLFDMQAELCHSLVQTQQQSLLDEPGSHQHFFQVRFCSRTFEYFSETFFFKPPLYFIEVSFQKSDFQWGLLQYLFSQAL